MIRAACVLLALAQPALAAEITQAKGAHLRVLDKTTGTAKDLDLMQGESREIGTLRVTLGACRYPAEDIELNAYAQITIEDLAQNKAIFAGWMVGDSPALSALDHHRYDVWVNRCMS